MYFSNGNIFAWLGENQGLGRIDFTDSTHKTVGLSYSSYNSTFLEAYNAAGTLIKTVSGPSNLNTGRLGKLSVSGDISHVLVHDSGNYWLIDDLFVTDGLADAQARMPGKFKRKLETVEKFNTSTTKQFTVFSRQGTDLKIVLEWPGSTFNVKLIDPVGNIASEKEANEPPIIIDAQTDSEGEWKVEVTAVEVNQDEPASLIIGAFEPEDIDSDGIANNDDNCRNVINPDQADADGDGVGDKCDNCATVSNSDQTDRFPLDGPEGPGNGIGDVCEDIPVDMDQDGIANPLDNCPYDANPDQLNTDGDDKGNVCDMDDDNDTVSDLTDNCPLYSNPDQADYDGDGKGDACDDDVDGDGVLNSRDLCVFTQLDAVVKPKEGCSIAQLCPCEGPRGTTSIWKNHGQYVSCVSKSAESFLAAGLITQMEKDAVCSEAGRAACGGKK